MPQAASRYFFAPAGSSARWHYFLCMGASLVIFGQEMFFPDFSLFSFPVGTSTTPRKEDPATGSESYTITSTGMPQWLVRPKMSTPTPKEEEKEEVIPGQTTQTEEKETFQRSKPEKTRGEAKLQQTPRRDSQALWKKWPEKAIIDYGKALEVGNICKRSHRNAHPVLPFPVEQLQSTIRFMLGYYAGKTPTTRQSAQAIHQIVNIRKGEEIQRIPFRNICSYQLNQLRKLGAEKISVSLSSAGVKGTHLEMNILCLYEFGQDAYQTVCRKAILTLDDNGRVETIESIMNSPADSEEKKFDILKLSEGFDYYSYPDTLIIEHKL